MVHRDDLEGATFCGLKLHFNENYDACFLRDLPTFMSKIGFTTKNISGPSRTATMTLAKCAALKELASSADSVVAFTEAVESDVRCVYPEQARMYDRKVSQWAKVPEEQRTRIKNGLSPTVEIE